MQDLQFHYFSGMEAEQYSFYRVPKMLFTEECFRSLSCEAKVLYGLMLDRMGLSLKNRWLDEKDRVYIIFTVEEIAETMGCGIQKAVKLVKELDTRTGIGLIEKRRLGLGRPNVIYVKNFMLCGPSDRHGKDENEKDRSESSENVCPEAAESEIQEFPKSQFKNCENHNSRSMKIILQEFPKSQSNDTDISETDNSDTEILSHPILSNPVRTEPAGFSDGWDMIRQMDKYREIIRQNIGYKAHAGKGVDELIELMVEVMVMPEGSTVRIAGVNKPVEVVKSRFMKLDYSHFEYVLFALQRNTSKVGNIKTYLLTALYNASLTINNFYDSEVRHDMYMCG